MNIFEWFKNQIKVDETTVRVVSYPFHKPMSWYDDMKPVRYYVQRRLFGIWFNVDYYLNKVSAICKAEDIIKYHRERNKPLPPSEVVWPERSTDEQ